MPKSLEKLVSVTVVATVTYCSNDCPGMSNDAAYCNYFEQPLRWDKRRLQHGNRRLAACKRAELKHPI